jgi:hypothetical protein
MNTDKHGFYNLRQRRNYLCSSVYIRGSKNSEGNHITIPLDSIHS